MTGVSVGWRERVVVAAAAALVGPVAYFRMAMAGQAPVGFDLVTYFYPYRNYLATAWAHHRWLPLWNSDIYFGAPFLANIQAAALYPLSVIFAFFPTERALGFAILLNLAIAGLGMCLYGLKSERLGAIGAVTAAIVFVLSGQMNAQMGHLNQGGTLCWAPWLMLAVDRLVVRPRPGKVAITAVLVALVILAGHTQQAYFTILFGAIAGAGRLWPLLLRQQWVRVVKRMAVGALALALGFGMAAAQLLPTLELVSLSFRHGGLSLQDAGSFSIPLKGFAGWLFPDYQNQQGAEFSAYVGMAALALGALAVVTRWRKPRIAFLAALAVAGVWLALGPHGHLYSIAFRLLPGLNLFRVPARLVIFSTVALALLAGHGAKIARQGTIAWSRRPLRPILARLLWASATMAEAPVVLLIVDHLAGYPQRSLLKALPVPVSWADLLGLATFSAATVALVAAGWMGSHR
ncbi:MAG TPA: hypothetical protein VG015_03515, partial [Candidatus Dormibacteraeota bacterium]|nr:hypothetical protein [Candidatus Dormibacteraeota bacterium]